MRGGIACRLLMETGQELDRGRRVDKLPRQFGKRFLLPATSKIFRTSA
jgi:hypothetical protein